jgi:hypothetical protein
MFEKKMFFFSYEILRHIKQKILYAMTQSDKP